MFQNEGVPYLREPILRIDFICYDKIIVDLKTEDQLVGVNRAQVISYLCASKTKLGLLINFGAKHFQPESLARHQN
jgi:GxxExxY protein